MCNAHDPEAPNAPEAIESVPRAAPVTTVAKPKAFNIANVPFGGDEFTAPWSAGGGKKEFNWKRSQPVPGR
jgi:hypothetical protein